jgi:AraC-like DNA-binding protein
MNLNVLKLLVLFSGFLLFLLGIIFLFYPHGKKINNYLLGAFMLANAVLLGNYFFTISFNSYSTHFSILSNIGYHSYLLLAPLLYLYIITLCKSDFHFSLKSFLHFLPFIVIVFLAFFIDFFNKESNIFMRKTGYYFFLIYRPFLYTQIVVYIVASFMILKNYRSELKELYSSLLKIDLLWINLVLYFLILMWSTDVLVYVGNIFHLFNTFITQFLSYLTVSTNLILCTSMIYKGMRQTTVLTGNLMPKYVLNVVEMPDIHEYRKKLDDIMEKEKLYLLSELNLDELAKRLNISSKQLSQTIHICYNLNFNNYINRHRVEEAKRIMESDKMNRKILYEILSDAGFNSKSVFNESFKKFTGVTPKEFRNKMQIISS